MNWTQDDRCGGRDVDGHRLRDVGGGRTIALRIAPAAEAKDVIAQLETARGGRSLLLWSDDRSTSELRGEDEAADWLVWWRLDFERYLPRGESTAHVRDSALEPQPFNKHRRRPGRKRALAAPPSSIDAGHGPMGARFSQPGQALVGSSNCLPGRLPPPSRVQDNATYGLSSPSAYPILAAIDHLRTGCAKAVKLASTPAAINTR